MNIGDYLIIALVIAGLIASIYYVRRAKKHGCSSCSASNSCPLGKNNYECSRILMEDENDKD
ncbi:MAG: FeoB-associated Cys-rich membrane protein [Syntrophomonadaceae bacterium]|nr:FeoB-associated Cys-rich membrane protein [Syntrophomonadaceae bacterium]